MSTTAPAKIPVVRHYIERHVFEAAYRGVNGLRLPVCLGGIAFPGGRRWDLYRITGAEYVLKEYNSKVFRRLDTVIADAVAAGGVKLLTKRSRLPLHAWFMQPCLAKAELDRAVADGTLTIAPLA
jgi:hypothetical protein